MRNDMALILTEVGRYRSRGRDKVERYRKWRWSGDEHDSAANRQRLRMGCSARESRDHLKPLERWIRAQVGQPWVLVEQELRAGLDLRNAMHRHLLDHVDRLVGRTRAAGGLPATTLRHPYIVDPDTGFLADRCAMEAAAVAVGATVIQYSVADASRP